MEIWRTVKRLIEVPRGTLTADEIAQTAEFFSFGTNDLTQTALGICRHFWRKAWAAISAALRFARRHGQLPERLRGE